MNKGLNTTNGFVLNNRNVEFHNERLPLNLSNFINQRFQQYDNPVTVEPFQLKNLFTNKVLNTLFDGDFTRLLSISEPVMLSAGENVYQACVPLEYIYFPENAVFAQLDILEDGRMCEIAMIGKEGVIGFPEIFNPHPSTFWTRVLVSGTSLRIRKNFFKREFMNNNTIQTAFIEYMNSYISQISQKAVCNNQHRMEERFCTWLLMLDDRCRGKKFDLTHEQIANHLGVNRPSITQLTKKLRDRNIISCKRSKLFIIDRLKLENSACGCYRAFSKNYLNVI